MAARHVSSIHAEAARARSSDGGAAEGSLPLASHSSHYVTFS